VEVPEQPDDPSELLVEFEATLVEMGAGGVERGGDPRKWNRMVDRVQSLHLRLRETPGGRAGITALASHAVPTVRQWAAGYALFWDEPVARAALEREMAADPKGLAAFEISITLREFDAGRLNTEWRPR
jgi:hypothetical protein